MPLFFAKLDNVFSLSSEIIIKFFFVKKELKKLEFIIVSFVFPDLELAVHHILNHERQ